MLPTATAVATSCQLAGIWLCAVCTESSCWASRCFGPEYPLDSAAAASPPRCSPRSDFPRASREYAAARRLVAGASPRRAGGERAVRLRRRGCCWATLVQRAGAAPRLRDSDAVDRHLPRAHAVGRGALRGGADARRARLCCLTSGRRVRSHLHLPGAAVGLGEIEPRDRRGRRADRPARRRRRRDAAAPVVRAAACRQRRRRGHERRDRGDHRGGGGVIQFNELAATSGGDIVSVIPWDLRAVDDPGRCSSAGSWRRSSRSRLIDDEAIETGATVLFAVARLGFWPRR